MRLLLTLTVLTLTVLTVTGCASTPKADWLSIVKESSPTFSQDKCGPVITFTKEVTVYRDAVVEGSLTLKKRCDP